MVNYLSISVGLAIRLIEMAGAKSAVECVSNYFNVINMLIYVQIIINSYVTRFDKMEFSKLN